MSGVHLESPLPAALPPDGTVAIFCSGTASNAHQPVAALELLVDGEARALEAVRMPRFELPVRRSGFWGVVAVSARRGTSAVAIGARVCRLDGLREDVELGEIPVREPPEPADRPTAPAPGGLIAICMATYDPDPELLRAQLESIRAQSDSNWICVISDDHSSPERYEQLCALVGRDERFVISRSPERLDFYRNFERALQLAPPAAELIALCDQDDVWHPDKLETLRTALGSAMLAYSDQRLVDREGRVLRETMWRRRANNATNLASMVIANTVTGAASLMRREVVQRALPFPDSPGIEFHDHWLAVVALACGELAYVDRPLYDYVQHGAAILGKVTGDDRRGMAAMRPRMRDWRAAYFLGYVPAKVRAQTALIRCENRLSPPKRRALERYLRAERSPVGLLWFALRPARALAGRNETLGSEWEILPGIAWRWLVRIVAAIPGWPERLLLDTRFPSPPVLRHRRMERWRSQL